MLRFGRSARVALSVAGAVVLAGLAGPGCSGPSRASVRTEPVLAILLSGPAEASFELVDHRVVVPVWINDAGPFEMILDTGATISSVSPEAARAAGLVTRDSARVTDAHGVRRRDGIARADSVSLGGPGIDGLRLGGVPMGVRALPARLTEGTDIVGILGFHAFLDHTLEIDYPARTVRVREDRIGVGEGVAMRLSRGDTPIVTVRTVDERGVVRATVPMLIDTGSDAVVSLGDQWWARLVERERAIEVGATLSGSGAIRAVSGAPFRHDLDLGGVVLERPTAIEAPGDPTHAAIDGRSLESLRVVIDARSRRALFQHAGGSERVRPPTWRVHGYRSEVLREGERVAGMRVADVFAGSPAEAGGLRVGDVVVAVDGFELAEHPERVPVPSPDAPDARTITIERGGERLDLRLGTVSIFEHADRAR